MKAPWIELATGLASALVSVLLVMGALLTSQAEVLPAPLAVAQITGTAPAPTSPPLATTAPNQPTLTPSAVPSATEVVPTRCAPPPPGWVSYTIRQGDTLETLAANFIVPADQITRFNCLLSSILVPDTNLYLPIPPTPSSTMTQVFSPTPTQAPTLASTPTPVNSPVPTLTSTRAPVACQHPAGWVAAYVVQQGDTLFSIARAYNLGYRTLQAANCLASPDLIYTGMRLFVPNIPTLTPSNTPTATRNRPTSTPQMPSATSVPPTDTPIPPSPTPLPPSDTPPPPTATREPPTLTPLPPTDVPLPTKPSVTSPAP